MAISLGTTTFVLNERFETPLTGYNDRERVVALSSDGTALTVRPTTVNGLVTGMMLIGHFRTPGTPTITFMRQQFLAPSPTVETLAVIVAAPSAVSITGTAGSGVVGADYTFMPVVTGGSGTKRFYLSSGTLPAGLSINPATGGIIGKPAPSATSATGLVISVQDASGTYAGSSFGIAVSGTVTPTPTPTPGTVAQPSGFPAMQAVLPTFSRSGSAGAYTFDDTFSWPATRAGLTPVQIYWVDNETGSNVNDGSQATPWRSLTLALEKAQAALPSLSCIKVKGNATGAPRRYLNTATQARTGDATSAFNKTYADAPNQTFTDMNVIIEPWADGELYDSIINAANVTWTATADANVWVAATGLQHVFDYSNMDGRKVARRVATYFGTAVTNATAAIAAVNALYGTTANKTDATGTNYSLGALAFDTANNLTYLRLWDNRSPNSDANLSITRTSIQGLHFNYSGAARSVYITGLGHYGGSGGLRIATNGVKPTIIFDRSRFCGGLGAGALSIAGSSDTVDGGDILSHECSAHGAISDGFNYQSQFRIIELDCWGTWNGWNTALSNNGSTVHWGCKIVRKGGVYIWNQDRSVHDVGDTFIWMMGAQSGSRRPAGDGTGLSIAFACGHQTEVGVTQTWIDGVTVFNTPEFNTACYTDDTLRYANLTFIPTAGPGTGTVVPYSA